MLPEPSFSEETSLPYLKALKPWNLSMLQSGSRFYDVTPVYVSQVNISAVQQTSVLFPEEDFISHSQQSLVLCVL